MREVDESNTEREGGWEREREKYTAREKDRDRGRRWAEEREK